jgi:hypothetical protein
MDDEGATALQQLADDRLGGRLRERVEELRAAGLGWRPVAVQIAEETRLGVGYETVRNWAERGGWNVDKPTSRAVS